MPGSTAVANSLLAEHARLSPVRTFPIAVTPGALAAACRGIDRDRREVVLRRDRVVTDEQVVHGALLNDAMMPDASVATSVTSVSPIISAAAVDAVRCGLRRAFRCRASSRPVRDDAGELHRPLGRHLLTALRTHITSTITRRSGLMSAPPRNARMRRAMPRPPRAVAEQPVRQREERPEDHRQQEDGQRDTGDINDDRRGRAATRRETPMNMRSTPTPIQIRTLVVPRPARRCRTGSRRIRARPTRARRSSSTGRARRRTGRGGGPGPTGGSTRAC